MKPYTTFLKLLHLCLLKPNQQTNRQNIHIIDSQRNRHTKNETSILNSSREIHVSVYS